MTSSLVVCITGAAGQIAYSLLPRLCSGAVFPNVELHIRLLDITPAIKVLKGIILELEDCDFPLVKSVCNPLFRSNSVTALKPCSKTLTSSSSLEDFLADLEWKGKIFCKPTKRSSFSKEKLSPSPRRTSNVLWLPTLPTRMPTSSIISRREFTLKTSHV